MRTDFEILEDGEIVILHPLPDNPLHKRPIRAVLAGRYFFCEGTDPMDGPDYYFGDVLRFNEGFTMPDDGGN